MESDHRKLVAPESLDGEHGIILSTMQQVLNQEAGWSLRKHEKSWLATRDPRATIQVFPSDNLTDGVFIEARGKDYKDDLARLVDALKKKGFKA